MALLFLAVHRCPNPFICMCVSQALTQESHTLNKNMFSKQLLHLKVLFWHLSNVVLIQIMYKLVIYIFIATLEVIHMEQVNILSVNVCF